MILFYLIYIRNYQTFLIIIYFKKISLQFFVTRPNLNEIKLHVVNTMGNYTFKCVSFYEGANYTKIFTLNMLS